jgi:hypothetical protein
MQPIVIASSPQRLESVALSEWARRNDVQGFDSLAESQQLNNLGRLQMIVIDWQLRPWIYDESFWD